MARSFQQFTADEFSDLLAQFPFTRLINAVHLHHTWRPRHRDYKGLETIVSMWRYHTEEKGWSDIAQHLTVAPDGTLWTGRNWNVPPASAAGHNGTAGFGPFMIEMIGDFDTGQDRLEGNQREAVLHVIAHLLNRFGLSVEAVRFHNQMSHKSCPGSSMNHRSFLDEVQGRLTESARATEAPQGMRSPADRPFGNETLLIHEALEASGVPARTADSWDAEPSEEGDRYDTFVAAARGRAIARGGGDGAGRLTPDILHKLREHVVNLKQGQFSTDGLFQTRRADVDAMFGEHLPKWLDQHQGETNRIVFYAHGGLTSEADGLWIAYQQLEWWKANGVYPIHFVWETGFLETLKQLLARSGREVPRAVPRDFWDFTLDPAIEAFCHAFGGVTIWSGMKRSAERSVASDGGALYVAQKLKDLCRSRGDQLELHAVGHSAGSIFHSHFVPAALNLGTSPFTSMHFLAPAITVDAFLGQLAGRVGQDIKNLVVFTMNQDLEKADHCANVYHKSLLYLIHHALEPDKRTPILGLETSLRDNDRLRKLFGLDGTAPSHGEIIWSKTLATTGRSASTSISHGGFDNDAPTMNSVVRRIINRNDTDPLAKDFPLEATRAARDIWAGVMEKPIEVQEMTRPARQAPPFDPVGSQRIMPAAATLQARMDQNAVNGRRGGRRRALCIGIDRYPTAPLAGCVADAREWADTLRQLGFEEPVLLLNEEATRQAILDALKELIAAGSPGDVVVFQYAGHGTQLPDEDGDDETGQDQAICSYDFADGRFVIDDDVAAVFRTIPEGLNVTCFIDCCHSGTITRFAVGGPQGDGGGDRRRRFLPATPAMKRAHLEFRRGMGRTRTAGQRGPETMREVTFSACLPSEVAYESDGHGDFTVRATKILRAGIAGLTHEQFQDQVTRAFGSMPQQHPTLDCAPSAGASVLLQPLERTAPAKPAEVHKSNGKLPAIAANGSITVELETFAHIMKALTTLLEEKVKS
ncbi:caspase family protein [Nitrospira sp. Nam80]